MKPIIEETLENGNKSLLTNKFKYEKTEPDRETKFQLHAEIASMVLKETL
jgi:hypothetical protein